MTTIWENKAVKELNEAIAFIAVNSPQNALMVLDRFLALSETLGFMPYKYPKEPHYNRENIRFTTKYNHKLIYQVEPDRIIILRIFPAKQDPRKLEKGNDCIK